MPDNEISKLVESLRVARDVAANEPDAEMLCFLIQQVMEEAIAEAKRRGQSVPFESAQEFSRANGSSIPFRGNGMTHEGRTNLSWYEIGKQQGIRAGKLGGEVQRHVRDFVDEEENARLD